MPWRDVVTEDTVRIVEELKKRKKKFDKMTTRHYIYAIITLVLVLFIIVYLYVFQQEQFRNPLSIISNNVFLMVTIATTLLIQDYYYRKKEKAKEKYHKLRTEVIDHLKTTWYKNGLQSETRDLITKDLSDNYKINITFKAK